MNWNQLYISATSEERLEVVILALQSLEARQSRLILSRGRLILERRGEFQGAHFLNDRRNLKTHKPRAVFLLSFIFTLMVVSIGIWISFFKLPPMYAAPLMLFHISALCALLLARPIKIRLSPSRA